ncbi:PREDICTED: putative fatty acyl-CoA reductase CG5065 isoform X2 [Trachymyrmex septentrionalis]|uniref:putative fatty acyl-CoA reductase CG5065 isoform X2 n=1 Tax=Trachymyrmex septentrionalis TaxID=34720 RepID=UPI00084F1C80|nr:PREDICTED: putative fatty acyl-CoA reductase CG5065 isoform X2 [Trachymyrmex septentrionalis]
MENNAANVYIPAFYAGRSIFITGATGFLGKALIEKLLRSCPEVAEIFILIRPKKGLSVNERLKKMLNNKLFDKLRNEQLSSFDKIIPVTGDVAAENLGLLAVDREILIDRVSIIFHVAASVRFDERLQEAVFNNTRSTRDICILAEKMKKLVVLLHISSTYTQIDKPVVDEIIYPTEFDWKKMIKIAESIDEHALEILTAKILGTMPNTYTFTKRLAEQVISDYSRSLPCVLMRPSIVISTLIDDPISGWLDNFNGPVGLLIGGGKGILRVLWCEPNIISDFMPVDVVIKALIIVAWKHGIKIENKIDVYNCSGNSIKPITLESMVSLGLGLTKDVPMDNILWKPGTTITKNFLIYYVLILLLHILPAIFLDGVMKLFGVRPILLRLQRKVYVSNSALSYFLLNQWKFINTKLLNILDNLSADNRKEFGFAYQTVDTLQYFKNGIIGGKIYLLNESMDDIEAAKRHYKRMDWVDTITKTLFIVTILWILYRQSHDDRTQYLSRRAIHPPIFGFLRNWKNMCL